MRVTPSGRGVRFATVTTTSAATIADTGVFIDVHTRNKPRRASARRSTMADGSVVEDALALSRRAAADARSRRRSGPWPHLPADDGDDHLLGDVAQAFAPASFGRSVIVIGRQITGHLLLVGLAVMQAWPQLTVAFACRRIGREEWTIRVEPADATLASQECGSAHAA